MASKKTSLIASIRRKLGRIEKAVRIVKATKRLTLTESNEAGIELRELKSIVKSEGKKWVPYLEKTFSKSVTTAQEAMRIAKYWEHLSSHREANPNLGKDEALRIIKRVRKQSRTNTQLFIQTLEQLQGGLTHKGTLYQSSCFAFAGGSVFTFNDEVGIRCESPFGEAVTGAVAGMPLLRALKLLGDERINSYQQKDGHFTLQTESGDSISFTIETVALAYDRIERPKRWKQLDSEFANAVRHVLRCVGKDESNYEGLCIHLHREWIEACDGSQAIRYHVKTKVREEALVRGASLTNIVGAGMTEFCETDNWIHFRNPAGLVLSCRRDVQEWEPLDNILNFHAHSLQLPLSVAKTCERAELFSIENPDENEVLISLAGNRMEITAKGRTGEFKRSLTVVYQGPTMSFSIGPRLLAPLVRESPDCTFWLADMGDKLSICTPEFTYCVGATQSEENKHRSLIVEKSDLLAKADTVDEWSEREIHVIQDLSNNQLLDDVEHRVLFGIYEQQRARRWKTSELTSRT